MIGCRRKVCVSPEHKKQTQSLTGNKKEEAGTHAQKRTFMLDYNTVPFYRKSGGALTVAPCLQVCNPQAVPGIVTLYP